MLKMNKAHLRNSLRPIVSRYYTLTKKTITNIELQNIISKAELYAQWKKKFLLTYLRTQPPNLTLDTILNDLKE